MAKVFVSYKHSDGLVGPLAGYPDTEARHYVEEVQKLLTEDDHIYKGERDGESLQDFKDETIASKLRDKIYDSTVTLVLISKGMKEEGVPEDDQWIPWELSYSLKEITRDGKTSYTNAVVGIVLPDENGSYSYFVEENICPNGCRTWHKDSQFAILGKNMFNRKDPKVSMCPWGHASGEAVHRGDDHSFIYPVKWQDFVKDASGCIKKAQDIRERIEEYDVQKMVETTPATV